jgi:hypothetical protein
MSFERIHESFEKYRDCIGGMARRRAYDSEAHKIRTELYARAAEALEAQVEGFKEIRRTAMYSGAVLLLLNEVTNLQQHADNDEVVWGIEWQRLGRPTFVVSESLMANLMLTDPGKVLTADVPWPFPAFKIALPSPGCPISVVSHALTKLVVPGASNEVLRSVSVLQWGQYHRGVKPVIPPKTEDVISDIQETVRAIHAQLPALERRAAVVVRGLGSHGTSVYHNQVWDEDQTVANWLQFAKEHNRNGETLADTDKRAVLMAQRVAVNLALYLASEDEETGKATWSPTDKTTGKGKNWSVGGKVKVSKEVREAAAEIAAGRAATCPAVKHIVRGHFRNQACGVGRLERKRLYIKPHWRGPDGTTPHERTYVMT